MKDKHCREYKKEKKLPCVTGGMQAIYTAALKGQKKDVRKVFDGQAEIHKQKLGGM